MKSQFSALSFLTPRSLSEIPVYKDPLAPKVNSDGEKVLGVVVKDKSDPLKSYVLVHPDHWDEFLATINSGRDDLSIGHDENAVVDGSDKPK